MSEKKASNLTKMCLGLSYLEPGSPLKAYALIKECDKEPELIIPIFSEKCPTRR